MTVILVTIRVKPEAVSEFKAATIANASASVREPGVERFDVIQQADDPTRFALVEVYRTEEAVAAHKTTTHYAAWRDTVADMMAEPRSGTRFMTVFPKA
jgi:quinol monooxygenase YgiN